MGKFKSTAGAQTSKRAKVWEVQSATIEQVILSQEPTVSMVAGKFGHSLYDMEDSMYVPLRDKVPADKDTYHFATFVAVSDWQSDDGLFSITKGDVKAMAW